MGDNRMKELIKEFTEKHCTGCSSYFLCGGESILDCKAFNKFLKKRYSMEYIIDTIREILDFIWMCIAIVLMSFITVAGVLLLCIICYAHPILIPIFLIAAFVALEYC